MPIIVKPSNTTASVRVLGEIPKLAPLNRAALLATFSARFDRDFFAGGEQAQRA